MEHHFNVEIATKLGVNKSIILYNLDFWIQKNRSNEINYFDGYYWTYNSVSAYKTLFPYLSEKAIYKALNDLESDGYIITGNYNNNKYNRTKWYALTEKYYDLLTGKCISPKGKMEDPKKENPFVQKVEITTDNKTKIKNKDKKQSKDQIDLIPDYDKKSEIEIPDGINKEAYQEWIEYKKSIKNKVTPLSAKKNFKLLSDFTEEEQQEMIDQAIGSGWKGLYPKNKKIKITINQKKDGSINLITK